MYDIYDFFTPEISLAIMIIMFVIILFYTLHTWTIRVENKWNIQQIKELKEMISIKDDLIKVFEELDKSERTLKVDTLTQLTDKQCQCDFLEAQCGHLVDIIKTMGRIITEDM